MLASCRTARNAGRVKTFCLVILAFAIALGGWLWLRQHAVASELLMEREAMKRRIGQDGVQIIDVNPEELSLAAVNKYLEIKARGSL